jgi:hypothetical protein
MTDTCKWKSTPFSTPFKHPMTGQQMGGFADEWTIGCAHGGTLRIEPRGLWKNCPYCGKPIEWKTDPTDPSLPQTIPKLV